MNNKRLKKEKNVVVIDFQNSKLRNLAKQYVKLYAEYGVEAASIWSMDKLTNRIEKKQFNKFVKEEMRKYGFRILERQQNKLDKEQR